MAPAQSAIGGAAEDGLSALDRSARIDIPFTILNVGSTIGAIVLPLFFTSASSVVAFLCMYTVCGLGLTAGYHRLFAHRSYAVPKWLEYAIATGGYLAIQRGPIFWVAMHRRHHADVELPQRDPHTPREGVWHVHFGWIQKRRHDVWTPSIYRRYTPELVGDPLYEWMDHEAHDYAAALALIIGSFLVGGLLHGGIYAFDLHNAMCFLVWVGLVNRVALLHAFGLINSACHTIGTRPFLTRGADESTNNGVVAWIIFGEGWHNNHHAFPTSARQGLRWYQLDVAWYVIWSLKQLGLATRVRTVSAEAMARRSRASVIRAGESPMGLARGARETRRSPH